MALSPRVRAAPRSPSRATGWHVNSLIANSLPPTGPLSRLAFGLEFDASRGSDESQAPVFEGDPQQLSAFSVKYEILNHRDPDSRQFQERADRLYAEAKSGTTTSTRAINQTLTLYESDFAGRCSSRRTAPPSTSGPMRRPQRSTPHPKNS
jgi:hypothetical protein